MKKGAEARETIKQRGESNRKEEEERLENILSATDKHFAFHKFCTGAKDRLSFKISHFAVQILRVDIQTKVRKIQELLENSDFGK